MVNCGLSCTKRFTLKASSGVHKKEEINKNTYRGNAASVLVLGTFVQGLLVICYIIVTIWEL